MKNKYPLVSIILVNWNGGKIFDECLNSLVELNYPNWELILVDNGSTDGSQYLVSKYKLNYKRYKLIQNKFNLGFATPNNQGYQESRGKYILLLNNDTKIKKDFLRVLVSKMEKDRSLGVVQPKIYLIDKPGYLDNAGTFLNKTGFLTHWGFLEKDNEEFNKERLIFSAKGACMLIRKIIIDQVGLFDDDFFAYFEESDFCWKTWLIGYKVKYFPDTYIYHRLGATVKKVSPIVINFHSLKNRMVSILKNVEFKNIFIVFVPHFIIVNTLGFYYLVTFQFKKYWMVFQSIVWIIRYLKSILNRRKKIQSKRKISDSLIFSIVGRKVNWRKMFIQFLNVEKNY